MTSRIALPHMPNDSREHPYIMEDCNEADEEDEENESDVPLNLVATSLAEEAQ